MIENYNENNSMKRRENDRFNVLYCTFDDMKQFVQKEAENERPIWIIRHPNDGGSSAWEAPSHFKSHMIDLSTDEGASLAREIIPRCIPRVLVITTDIEREMRFLRPTDGEAYLIRELLWRDALNERIQVVVPRSVTPTTGLKNEDSETSFFEPEFVREISSCGIEAVLPHICHAPPIQGYALALALSARGRRTIVFAPPQLNPKRCEPWPSEMTIVDADIESGTGFHVGATALQQTFDAVIFISDEKRLLDEVNLTETEELLLNEHMLFLLYSRERVFSLQPS